MSVGVMTANPTVEPTPEFRAGGTDFSERRRSGVSQGTLIDISATGDKAITWDADGAARIGALNTIATIATDARIAAAYPGIAASAQGLATPQVRHVATLGGNLAQRSRCWYFRRADIDCLKKSGSTCPARSGNHLYGVAFDLGPCVAPHPSTMAAALLAYDATITTDRRGLTIAGLLGDGSVSHADHTLEAGEMIRSIDLPAPLEGERASYKRAISRSYAEWPLVELCARVVIADGKFQLVRLAAGGVAPVPLRLTAAEVALHGKTANTASIAEAAKAAISGAKPLPMTAYKLDLLQGLVRDVLEQLLD
ncbi:FAD binding domain-containing protein [Bradyrhizobium arachidis]|uniref:FAD binding domain-containing protein n=1 Tax=Bradyrhizobium TaxID=374 RepID=UPI002163FB77|nr:MULTISPECIES: FAD binding domain-containing protein [Bradyrhizobium]MDN4987641.1 FAD binding domain-containing protein [Bradyrhizobium sp. WYCCWR 13022]UVO36926.1 FAD binding domain-containing protein [Bradyrhizobium arachidis]